MTLELLWLVLWPSLVVGAYGAQIYSMTRVPKPTPCVVTWSDTVVAKQEPEPISQQVDVFAAYQTIYAAEAQEYQQMRRRREAKALGVDLGDRTAWKKKHGLDHEPW